MKVLIVESRQELAGLWGRHLERQSCEVIIAADEDAAVSALRQSNIDVVILDLVLPGGGAFAVADFAAYRRPCARVIFVTNTSFFSDGSIFQHIQNAAAFVQTNTPPDDIAALVEHHCPKLAVAS